MFPLEVANESWPTVGKEDGNAVQRGLLPERCFVPALAMPDQQVSGLFGA